MRTARSLMSACLLSLILGAWLVNLRSTSSVQQLTPRTAATTQQSSEKVRSENSASKRNKKDDLISLIDTASYDIGELGKEAKRKLLQDGRENFIRTLSTLRDSLREGDIRRVEIAYLFCSINHEYRANRQVIVSAFDRNSPYSNLLDDVWMMIDKLINSGDKSLLSLGFNAVKWTDGALAEGMIDTFDDQLAHDPESFLKELAKQPRRVRREVYEYIVDLADQFGFTYFDKLKRYLKSVPARSPLSQTAKEFSAALSAKPKAEHR